MLGETICPGCGLRMPASAGAGYGGKFNASAECWAVFLEVVAGHFNDPHLFGRAHQLTVDAYAVQHAGGRHPDKSVDVHLTGLYLVLERSVAPTDVPPLLQRLAGAVTDWPHLAPPAARGGLTVFDAALVPRGEHLRAVRAWAEAVWDAWAPHHGAVAELFSRAA